MNRRLLTGFVILVSLAVLVDRSHAWDQDPIAIIYPWYLFEKVGEEITFDACNSYDPDNGYPYGGGHGLVCCYLWTWPPEAEGITEYAQGGDDWTTGWAKCHFDTPGIYYVYVEVEDDEGATGTDYAKAHVIRVTLDGGGYLALNDLAQISLSIEPSYPTLDTGDKVLRALSGGDNIKVWYDSQRQQECQLPRSWGFDGRWQGGPSELWVEGITTSSSLDDVVLELSYEYESSKIDSDTTEFTIFDAHVTQIQFDHSTGDSADGINIRENYSTDISVPEWVKGGQNKPAAYKKSTSVTIKARFTVSPSAITSAKIKATTSDTTLGDLQEQTVTFSGGISHDPEYVSFTPDNSTPSTVDKATVEWHWKVRDIQGGASGECEFASSGPHTIYTVLSTPQAPQAEPWTETLDIACTVADGRSTAGTATRDIWDDFYYDAGGTYDTSGGWPQYTPNGGSGIFHLTEWLHNYPSIGTVNCYDMGKSVVVFANALGCDTQYVFVLPFGYLNCIKPIGCGWTNNPFDPSNPIVDGDSYRTGFGNHGFSRLSGYIYDGSVGRVDIDNDPDYGPPFTEYELDGGETWANDYDGIVIDYVPTSNPGTPSVKTFSVD